MNIFSHLLNSKWPPYTQVSKKRQLLCQGPSQSGGNTHTQIDIKQGNAGVWGGLKGGDMGLICVCQERAQVGGQWARSQLWRVIKSQCLLNHLPLIL